MGVHAAPHRRQKAPRPTHDDGRRFVALDYDGELWWVLDTVTERCKATGSERVCKAMAAHLNQCEKEIGPAPI